MNEPATQRSVTEQRLVQAEGLRLSLVSEDVCAPTAWRVDEAEDTVVVHLAGQLKTMECVFAGGPATDVLPSIGDVWVIPAGCRYEALAQGGPVRFAEFRLPPRPGAAMAARVAHRDAFLHAATARAAALCARQDDLAGMLLQALLATLHLHIADALAPAPGRGDARAAAGRGRFSTRQQQRLVEHIAGRLHAALSVDELAAVAGVSRPHLLGGFKATFGTTPWQYVLRVRLAEARRLLDGSRASVTTIAAATGFSSPGHLATSFGKHYGLSPLQYRLASRRGVDP